VGELPDLDGVLISHEHYDHCDLNAFTYRNKHVPLVVPKTVVEQARRHGFDNIHSLEPWQSEDLGGVTITAVPGKHGVYEITLSFRKAQTLFTLPGTRCSFRN
jgi:L-ascorbate metabolism protein UlaG (beta-lactamase superfamily)